MKTNLRMAVRPVFLRSLCRWVSQPTVEKGLQCLGITAVGFVLAGVAVGGIWLPLPICLSAALGLNLMSFMAYIGGCLGYLLFWDAGAAMEPMAVGLLVEACLCIFGDQIPSAGKWMPSAMTMVFTALVGFLFLLEQGFAARAVWQSLLRIAAAGGGTLCFVLALRGEEPLCRLIVCAMLCGGLCALQPLGLPLGVVAACVLAAAALDTAQAVQTAVLCGLALDLCWGNGSVTALLALGALVGRGPRRILRTVLWLCCLLLGVLLTDGDLRLLAAAVPGAILAPFLPAELLFGALPAVSEQDDRMDAAAELLDQLSQCLEPARKTRADPETAAVFDHAAERVCRMCSQWDDCWDQNAMVTVDALERAAPAMMTRGKAVREDLPQLFVDRCCHLEGFLTAVNRELEDLSCRRQCRSRIRESRMVLARQYGILSRSLRRDGAPQERDCRYLPEVGFRSKGRMEDTVSGDRGATFRIGRYFYLILCDGMGTGPGAAAEAGAAIGILRTLLQSGAEPAEAMEFLNGIYILREDGGFATVDLLQADLFSGEAALLKWGASPSYLKHRQTVEKLGTVSPPPGIGIGDDYGPETLQLSLAKGELLVLTSDGAGGEAAERFLRQYGGLSPKELASGIVNSSENQGEDDRTAAVVILRPRSLAPS